MKEVIVIGGGVVGLWCAYHLHERGMKVTIIDKGNMNDGCSYGNAGMVVPSHFVPLASPGVITQGIKWMFKKDSPFYIKPRLNLDMAQWLWKFYRASTKKHVAESIALLRDMHLESKAMYLDLQQHASFDFGFLEKGILMLFQSADAEEDELETAALAHQLGLEANHLSGDQLNQIEPEVKIAARGAVHYPGDAHMHPGMLMEQMIAYLKSSGVEMIPNQEVLNVDDLGKEGTIVSLKDGAEIKSRYSVVCGGIWSSQLLKKSGVSIPLQDGKGYSIDFSNRSFSPSIPSILHEARVAVTPMGKTLRIAGTLEISGLDDNINTQKVSSILDAVPQYYPDIKLEQNTQVWSGFRPCTPDGLPFIGRLRSSSSVILATGHAMMGLSLAPVTGRMVADEILHGGGHVIHAKLLPGRFS